MECLIIFGIFVLLWFALHINVFSQLITDIICLFWMHCSYFWGELTRLTLDFIKVRHSLSLLEFSLQYRLIICTLCCFMVAIIYCCDMFSSKFSGVNLLSTHCLFCKWELHNVLMSRLVLKWSKTRLILRLCCMSLNFIIILSCDVS